MYVKSKKLEQLLVEIGNKYEQFNKLQGANKLPKVKYIELTCGP